MHNTAIVALWVPVVVLAHVFAAFWFLKTYLLYDPRPLAAIRRRRSSGAKLPKARVSEVEDAREKATHEDIILTLDKAAQPKAATAGLKSREQDPEGAACNPRGVSEVFDDAAHADKAITRVERVNLEWQQISCAYSAAAGRIVVLHDVWGQALPGEMQALLGPSGAGKSTLMDILAQRKSIGQLSGFLLVNGRPATSSFIRKTAYVPQEDNFVATMTVSETMNFYADIILPQHWSAAQRKARVADVLAAMGLRHKHKTMVGGTLPGGLMLRGLSGGERKRLSIAAGILAAPSVVFLDEPTSGLDSFAALTVMGYLKRMARDNGHVVIASIHQPRSAIWSMFDKVTLLASGCMMYHGPQEDMVPWFDHLGYSYHPSMHGVASDWALDLVAIGFHKPQKFYGHTIRNMDELNRASSKFVNGFISLSGVVPFAGGPELMIGQKSLGQKVQAQMSRIVAMRSLGGDTGSVGSSSGSGIVGDGVLDVASSKDSMAVVGAGGAVYSVSSFAMDSISSSHSKQSKWATGWWRQFASCYGREVLSITRNPADVAGRTMTFAWIAILMGLLYYGMPDDATSIRGRLNMTFNILSFFCLMPYVSMSLYNADKKFYIADATAKLYRPHAYYAAKVAATTPFQIVSALVFSFIVYGMAGLRPGAQYIWESGIISTLLSLIAVQVLHCSAILAPNQDAAFMLSILWTAIQLLMSNFFITFTEVVFRWMTVLRWVSALYYAFEGLAVTEFGGMTYRCDQGLNQAGIQFLRTLLPKSKFLNAPAVVNGLKNPGDNCLADTNAVLGYYGFNRPFNHTFGILLGYLVLMHLLTYCCMVIVVRRERR